MLIQCTVENWMSFRDKTIFSLIATREQQHGDRLAKLGKYRMRVLPSVALYGGNASGKTNFFKAINFAKQFVTRPLLPKYPIKVEPFFLHPEYATKPVRFHFEILVDDDIYELEFALTDAKVIEERLVKIASANEKVLYHRIAGSADPHLHASVASQRLLFAFEGTQENQLFLTNSVFQNIPTFRNVFHWFDETLVMVAPDTRFETLEYLFTGESELYETLNTILPTLDTGICRLEGEDISLDSLLISDELKQKIKEDARCNMTMKLNDKDEKIIVTRQDGKLSVKKLYTYHKDSQGKDTRFEMRQESDGSKRILDLLPAFLDLANASTPKVYFIDEIDRNLHSLLTRQLLKVYLASCSETSRKQLIFTTHDLLLMDQSMFRRDEMWLAERKGDGSSLLIAFSEYEDVRRDKDILKSYLQGRMGGVPTSMTADIFSGVADKYSYE